MSRGFNSYDFVPLMPLERDLSHSCFVVSNGPATSIFIANSVNMSLAVPLSQLLGGGVAGLNGLQSLFSLIFLKCHFDLVTVLL